ncbi:MAG: DnaA/Hda family protein [Planctomycetota bacterium]
MERPSLRGRRRDLPNLATLLPYFVCGEENRLAGYLATISTPVLDLGNPLLLFGASGSGKTALSLHFASRHLSSHQYAEPPSVVYQTANDFARHYAEAVAADDLPHLREQLATAELLILDDLHLISDKPAAQEELALRIEERCVRELPTIVTCSRLPSEIRGMKPLLISRVLPGLTVHLNLPTGPARRQLLSELAMRHEVELTEHLLSLLDTELETPLPCRALEAAIKQISLRTRMQDCPVDAESIRAAIDVVGRAHDLSPAIIASAVAKHSRLRLSDLRSSSRKQHLVRARSLAMYLTRKMTALSMHQIGDYFGGRDHTTVLHAIRKTESTLNQEPELRQLADEVTEKLHSV